MHLNSLRLTNFRNFSEQRLEIPSAGLAVIGDNGQGKTNLLEAIYYLEIFRSFRGAPDEQLVRFGQDVFRVEARVAGDSPIRSIAAAYDRRQKKKRVRLDGAEPERLTDGLGRIGIVIFSPSDVALVSGSPAGRRRFLDILLSLASPTYLEDLKRYRQVLLQRNAVLRRAGSAQLVAAWNAGLVRFGSRITLERALWIKSAAPIFAARVRDVSGGAEASLEYEPGISLPESDAPEDLTAIAEVYLAELDRVGERERRQAATLVGPHRDDFRIRAQPFPGAPKVDLRTYGSGGQQRTAAVALRMVEGENVRERLDSDPVILLDDVFAELDAERSERILAWVEADRTAQVILTAPKPGDFPLRGGSLMTVRVSGGVVSEL